MEDMRRQVQGQVIKLRYFHQLENIPQSSAQQLMKRQSQREKKNRLWDKGDSQPAHGLMAQCQQPRPSQTVDPSKKKYQRDQSLLLFQTPHFVLKKSITRADPTISWIMVILYKLQKSQEIGQAYLSCMRITTALKCFFLQVCKLFQNLPQHTTCTDTYFFSPKILSSLLVFLYATHILPKINSR